MIHDDDGVSGGLTRRAALRAGVAVGVGVAAWSGASITSFGGTPAYASVCTKAIPPVDISGGCRNTTQSGGCSGEFAFQPAVFSPPAGYSLSTIANNVCCGTPAAQATFTFPSNTTCGLLFTYYDSKCGTAQATLYGTSTVGPDNASPMIFDFPCPQNIVGNPNWSNTQYTISAHCFTGEEEPPPECF